MMRKLAVVLAAAAAIGVAAPASAQLYLGADPGGVGVQVGPFGAGIGPDYWGPRQREYYTEGYGGGECSLVRQRVVTPSGRVVYRTQRVCD
jgi:hypothetical protein